MPRLFQGVKQLVPDLVVKSSKGAIVSTECGRKFLDFSCGIGVTNLGHCHAGVTRAVQKAAGELVHAQQNIMRHRPMVDLIDRLAALPFAQNSNLDSWFFWNSGAEAVEAAVKLARQATNKQNIIAVNLGYHGRTYGTMALTTSGTIYRNGFGPFMGGVAVTSFPYVSQGPYGKPDLFAHQSFGADYTYWGASSRAVAELDSARCLEQLELLLRTQVAPAETAAVLLEPVLGEGGYLPTPPGFLSGLREICNRHNILLICDEVQTGYGRTGTMFASEWLDGGVKPDILICAKGIANGFPLSAVATRSELSAKQPPGSMGGTYGANAVSCAAALAVLDAFRDEKVLDNVARSQDIMLNHFKTIQSKVPSGFIREVRGRGLMFGVELNRLPGGAFGAAASAVVYACQKKDLLLLSCGPYDTIRLIPPLNVTTDELNRGMDIFTECLTDVANTLGKKI